MIEPTNGQDWLKHTISFGWPIQAVHSEDVLVLRSLLEATRKLQRQFLHRQIDLFSVVFIRNDIYQHLVLEPADRGKDTPVVLDWNDRELLKDVIGRRIAQSSGLETGFDEIWATFFTPHVRGVDSFEYVLNRTLMRPREVLRFVRECINTAVNRRRVKVSEADILDAEHTYSADALVDITLEMKDVKPEYGDVPYAFIDCPVVISRQQVEGLYLSDYKRYSVLLNSLLPSKQNRDGLCTINKRFERR